MFEVTETHPVETIYLRCTCGAEFNRECIKEFMKTDTILVSVEDNPKHRTFLAEIAADEWLEFHKGCCLTFNLHVPFNPESLEENFMP